MNISIFLKATGVEDEAVELEILGSETNNGIFWKSKPVTNLADNYTLEFFTDDRYNNIRNLVVSSDICSSQEEILEKLTEALLNLKVEQETDAADGLEHSDETDDDDAIPYDETPYDPKRIRVDSRPLSIEYVVRIISSGKLDISPDFQRQFVWTDAKTKSRLIESIMLRIPLPVFYLSQDNKGDYKVIDGLQRLSVIHQFVNNKFKLSNLEYLSDELNGKWFQDEKRKAEENLPSLYRDRILETQLHFNIIDPSTPDQVKYDIFRRINTGGKQLNPQEIRNCLSSTSTRKLLSNMVKLESFRLATRNSIRSTRMADKELALRFASFYMIDSGRIEDKYKGGMSEFLDSMNNILNEKSGEDHKRILSAFDLAMSNAYILFGATAFRKANYINKALFLSWSRNLWQYSSDQIRMIADKISMQERLRNEINNNEQYAKAISSATNDVINIDKAYNIAKKLLKGGISDDN